MEKSTMRTVFSSRIVRALAILMENIKIEINFQCNCEPTHLEATWGYFKLKLTSKNHEKVLKKVDYKIWMWLMFQDNNELNESLLTECSGLESLIVFILMHNAHMTWISDQWSVIASNNTRSAANRVAAVLCVPLASSSN